jgi:hypothetical protein
MVKHADLEENSAFYWTIIEREDGKYEFLNEAAQEYMHIQNQEDYVEISISYPVWMSRKWFFEPQDDSWFCFKSAWLGNRANIANEKGYLEHKNNPAATNEHAQWKLELVDITASNVLSIRSIMQYYPNPVLSQLTIDTGGKGVSTVIIIDCAGKERKKVKFTQDQRILDISMSDLETGLYFIHVLDNNKNSESIRIAKI